MLSGPVRAGYWGLVSGKEEIEHFGGEIRRSGRQSRVPLTHSTIG
jgi:hypothetical protein